MDIRRHVIIIIFFFFGVSCGMWDLNSWRRDRTHASAIEVRSPSYWGNLGYAIIMMLCRQGAQGRVVSTRWGHVESGWGRGSKPGVFGAPELSWAEAGTQPQWLQQDPRILQLPGRPRRAVWHGLVWILGVWLCESVSQQTQATPASNAGSGGSGWGEETCWACRLGPESPPRRSLKSPLKLRMVRHHKPSLFLFSWNCSWPQFLLSVCFVGLFLFLL